MAPRSALFCFSGRQAQQLSLPGPSRLHCGWRHLGGGSGGFSLPQKCDRRLSPRAKEMKLLCVVPFYPSHSKLNTKITGHKMKMERT